MIEKAFAKINLFLDVLNKRDDGFHNLRSVMQSISLCDTIEININKSYTRVVGFRSDVPEISNKDNLAYRAAEMYLAEADISAEVDIYLKKVIPIGAGLGGGSADAAAVLRALNRHFGVFSDERILKIAARLGSDVPFCFIGGTVLCEGRGEIMTPIIFDSKLDLVVAIGDERISTPRAYEALDRQRAVESEENVNLLNRMYDKFLSGLRAGYLEIDSLYNSFEIISNSALKNKMQEAGARAALMSGSGPAVFGIFDTKSEAELAAMSLKEQGINAIVAQSAYKFVNA